MLLILMYGDGTIFAKHSVVFLNFEDYWAHISIGVDEARMVGE
jgi:hypothetical protein